MPEYPKIAEQNAAYVERQMLGITSTARANGDSAAMKAVMDLVMEDEVKELAAYIASTKDRANGLTVRSNRRGSEDRVLFRVAPSP